MICLLKNSKRKTYSLRVQVVERERGRDISRKDYSYNKKM